MASMAILTRKWKPFSKILNPKLITTYTFLSQEAQLSEQPPPPTPRSTTAPLPPNPATGSPLYNENWRNPNPNLSPSNSASLIPLGFAKQHPSSRIEALAQTLDCDAIMNLFAGWMTSQRWSDIKQLFEFWIRSLDINGKPNKPDVNLYNHYLRSNIMIGASAGELLDFVAQMDDYNISPNTASFNLVLKAMFQAGESDAAVKLIDRMIETGKSEGALPDDESYHLVVQLLLGRNRIDAAIKYINLTLDSGYMLSVEVFTECVQSCAGTGRLDELVSIIERCKKMDQNKALCPPWNLCNYIIDVATQSDNSDLAFYGLEFMARWIARGEIARPPLLLSVDEGLVVNALTTAGRNYNSKLLDGTWAILKRSLRQKRAPSPESYLAKVFAYSSFGNLQKAFSTLHEFEIAYKDSPKEAEEDMFSPFTTLYPLVVACSKNGFATLDSVYYQLENLSQADPPYKSVAALNCVILGCANIWDVDRAYQTFSAMESSFGLTPNIHSYNALLCAFGKLNKRDDAVKVFEHLVSLGVKPNAKSYALLIDAHLIKRDSKASLSAINDMVVAGFEPTKDILKKVRRRCVREMDNESNDKVELLAKDFKIRMGTENRRDLLFNLEFSTEYA